MQAFDGRKPQNQVSHPEGVSATGALLLLTLAASAPAAKGFLNQEAGVELPPLTPITYSISAQELASQEFCDNSDLIEAFMSSEQDLACFNLPPVSAETILEFTSPTEATQPQAQLPEIAPTCPEEQQLPKNEIEINAQSIHEKSPETSQAAPLVESTQHEQNQESTRLSVWVIKGAAFGLGLLGFISGTRGSIMAISHFWKMGRDKNNLLHRRCLASPSINVHTFEDQNGETTLSIRTKKVLKFSDIFQNVYARTVFKAALECCTVDQPFPSLNLGKAGSNPLTRFLAGDSKGDKLQRILLREINKLFCNSFSELSRDAILAKDSGQIPTVERNYFLIPYCEIDPGGGRDLVFIAISEDNFKRFESPEGYKKLLAQNPRHASRIAQLKRAFDEHQLYKTARNGSTNHEEADFLFPRVNMCIIKAAQAVLNGH